MPDPLTIATGVGAVGSFVTGLFGSRSQSRASRRAADIQERGLQQQLDIFNQLRDDQEPFRQTGLEALNVLGQAFGLPPIQTAPGRVTTTTTTGGINNEGIDAPFFPGSGETTVRTQTPAQRGAVVSFQDILNQFRQTPGFQFRQQQGEDAIARAAAARGLNQSGATVQALTEFNNNLAGDSFNRDFINPLFSLAGFGPNATGAQQTVGTDTASAIGNTNANLANIAVNQGNQRASAFDSANNALQGGLQNFTLLELLRRQNQGSTA